VIGPRARAIVAVVALTAWGLGSLAIAVKREASSALEPHAPERPLYRLRAFLPERGTVGFVTDRSRLREGDERLDDAELYLMGFELAPLVVVADRPDLGFVVLDFEDAAAARDACVRGGLTVVHELEPGLLVARRR
jgi:hypothetical protein